MNIYHGHGHGHGIYILYMRKITMYHLRRSEISGFWVKICVGTHTLYVDSVDFNVWPNSQDARKLRVSVSNKYGHNHGHCIYEHLTYWPCMRLTWSILCNSMGISERTNESFCKGIIAVRLASEQLHVYLEVCTHAHIDGWRFFLLADSDGTTNQYIPCTSPHFNSRVRIKQKQKLDHSPKVWKVR